MNFSPPTILYRIDPAENMRRRYYVGVQATLFEEWAVVCGWGRIGSDYARWRILPAENQQEAEAMAAQIVAKKVRRGYRSRIPNA